MQKAEGRRQNEVGSLKSEVGGCLAATREGSIYQKITFVLCVAIILSTSNLFADGGTLRLAQRYGNLQVSVFTTPAVLRVGSVDVSVLVQDATTGKIRDDNEISIVMKSIDRPDLILQKTAVSDVATNKLFRAALFDLPEPGTWRASVLVNSQAASYLPTDGTAPPQAFDLSVGPPLPAWLEIAPWIGWPFIVLALFILHHMFVYRSSRANLASKSMPVARPLTY